MSDLPERVTGSPATVETPTAPEPGRGEGDSLPKELTSAGVTIHPTTIPVPQPVAKMGVQATGANIPTPAATVSLPLTDDQIATGLNQGIASSWRWLATWCIRRLKQVHMGLKAIHGKVMRVNI